MPTVILSQRGSADSNDIWRAALARKWGVHRAIRFAPPDASAEKPWCTFAEAGMADIIAARCGLGLLDPPDDFLPELPAELTQRMITCLPVAALSLFTKRAFFKPANDKFFHRGVFERGADVPVRYVDKRAPVIISEVVNFEWEFRLHCLDRQILTASNYQAPLGGTDIEEENALIEATEFGDAVLRGHGHRLPSSVVLDVGKLDTGAWAVVEANQVYSSGMYELTDMDAVLDCILRAAGPLDAVSEDDRAFLRPRIEFTDT